MNYSMDDLKPIITCDKFPGYSQTFLQPDGIVMYSQNETFDQYNARNGGNFKVVSWDEFNELYDQFEDALCGPWQQIDGKAYSYAFECVPPKRYTHLDEQTTFFFNGECWSGLLYNAYIRHNDKCYTALRRIITTNEELLKDFITQIKTQGCHEEQSK